VSEPTPEQVERGTTALVPFVQEWGLPLNPENLDEMAYAVLKHARRTGPIEAAEYEEIDRAVRAPLAESS
jgi:hypothetical protein